MTKATKPALLVLAAGIGSRYGGLKQIDPVGPGGETIIDYSVYDAIRAGFGRLVFVIRKDIERAFRDVIGSRFEQRIGIDYVFQELEKLPAGFSVPRGRVKPWGTGHAVLMGAETLHEPFAVINGDDFYGRNSFALLSQHLQSGSSDLAMVGFVLKNTLSEFGSVARGVCQTDVEGYLETVAELTRIERDAEGAIKHTDSADRAHRLTGDEIVSLNTWGFTPELFPLLRDEFARFLERHGAEAKAEFFIPTAINNLIGEGRVRLKVLPTPDSWFGVTYREDRPRVIESIQRLVKEGVYPDKLWPG
jgi:dTDP-glucose pyrophosphorylase